MKLTADHRWTYISGTVPWHLIDPVTSYKQEGYWFSKAYKRGTWDGRVRYVKYDRVLKQHYFATGLLTRVTSALDAASWNYELEDSRIYDYVTPIFELSSGCPTKPNIRLDEEGYIYQSKAVQACLLHGRGIIKIATGGGKTEVGASVIKSIGKQTIWLTHRRNLLRQTADRLSKRLQQPIGVIGDGSWDLQQVTVGMVQSLDELDTTQKQDTIKWLNNCEVVIGDEIHHLESEQWWLVFSQLKAPWRFGLSATPSLDGAGIQLVAMTGDVIFEITAEELISEYKVLMEPNIWIKRIDSPKIKADKYPTVYSEGVVHNTIRNTAIVDIAEKLLSDGKPPLILVKRLNHGNLLADMLCFKGLNAVFLNGSSSQREREESATALKNGTLDTIVGMAEIFGEGQDWPFLKSVINATGAKCGGDASEGDTGRQTIQFVGRGLRKDEGKTTFDFVDFADMTNKKLLEDSLGRIGTLESEGYGKYIRYWEDYR